MDSNRQERSSGGPSDAITSQTDSTGSSPYVSLPTTGRIQHDSASPQITPSQSAGSPSCHVDVLDGDTSLPGTPHHRPPLSNAHGGARTDEADFRNLLRKILP